MQSGALEREIVTRTGRHHLLEDCGGLIEELAITVPPIFIDDPRRAAALAALGNLVVGLPSAVTLFVTTADVTRDAVAAWLCRLRPVCRTAIVDRPTSVDLPPTGLWAQDSMLVAKHGEERRFLWPRSDNSVPHATWLAQATAVSIDRAALHLSGGNCLVGPDFWLVGADSLRLTAAHQRSVGASCKPPASLADLDARRLHVIGLPPLRPGGPIRQPDFHLDRFISVTGLVDKSQRPIVLVAQEIRLRPQVWGRPLGKDLDAIADQLDAAGFTVIRNPMPHWPMPQTIDWKLRSYNNVMVENVGRGPHARPLVWLPCFSDLEPDLREFDDHNAEIWSGLGFDVRRIPGWTALAPLCGALRCASKVLKRAEAAGAPGLQASGNSAHLRGRNATRDLVAAG